jgi:hypothetical protein
MQQHPNLSAYNDVENLNRFTDQEFINYCNKKLRECDVEREFIKKHCVDSQWRGKVCEIGSGNSKLLYNLEKGNLLQEGIGYEISQSRYLFAEKFKSYVESRCVQNINNNFLEEKPTDNFDIVIGMDIVFQFIAPLYPDAIRDSLKWIYQSLRTDGYLLLELRDFNEFHIQIKSSSNGRLNHWEEFAAPDPFEFVLASIYYDEEKYLHWDKTFLERKNGVKSKFNNILKPYFRDEIKELLEAYNFHSVKIFDSFSPEINEDTYIVLAKK